MTAYFHQAVINAKDELPAVPPTLLMVMGISSAVYLTSKQMGQTPPDTTRTGGKAAPDAKDVRDAG